ncbi:MAG: hypothetical protein QW279_14000 [Candidatus Jordarchaeaceae archaeon]
MISFDIVELVIRELINIFYTYFYLDEVLTLILLGRGLVKSMIYGVWLFKKTGECLIHRVYRDSKITRKDSTLLGSIFAAIDQTAKIHTGKEISKIDTQDTKLSYINFDDFAVVVAADNEREGDKIGKDVGEQFNKDYGEKLPTWDGNTAIFERFKEKVDEIIKFHERKLEIEFNELLDTLSLLSEDIKTNKE